MQAAIASSSISPYMWIVSGPMSTVPLCGEGIEASRVTRQRFCLHPRRPRPVYLKDDAQCQLDRAAGFEEVDRAVEVDVVPAGDLHRRVGGVAGALECLGPPGLDE